MLAQIKYSRIDNKYGSEVVGIAYYSICSRFIADQARNPSHTELSLKILNFKCILFIIRQFLGKSACFLFLIRILFIFFIF